MKRFVRLVITIICFLPLPNVYALPLGGELLEGRQTETAVILAHGRGEGPDGKIVGQLRKSINKELGFYTLALQMPVLPTTDFNAYASTFPDAYKTIQSAIDYLTGEKGIKRFYLMGYSMGARMTASFLVTQQPSGVVGFIGVGVLEGGGEPLDANISIRRIHLPVIDLYADSTPFDLKSAEDRRSLISDHYKQVRIEGATHRFDGYDSHLAQEIIEWLKNREHK